MATLAFDVYGTLIDTAGVLDAVEEVLGDAPAARAFCDEWRRKQLEYTFRYGLMGHYQNFRVCTRQALDYCCAALRAKVSVAMREHLMGQYLCLPAFADVPAGLARLKTDGFAMHALSNGLPGDLEKLLTGAGIRDYFATVVSVDEVATFKPAPAVYAHFLKRTSATAASSWLISSNPFDICGARAAGLRAVWMRRRQAEVFDPWEFSADFEAATCGELAQRLPGHLRGDSAMA